MSYINSCTRYFLFFAALVAPVYGGRRSPMMDNQEWPDDHSSIRNAPSRALLSDDSGLRVSGHRPVSPLDDEHPNNASVPQQGMPPIPSLFSEVLALVFDVPFATASLSIEEFSENCLLNPLCFLPKEEHCNLDGPRPQDTAARQVLEEILRKEEFVRGLPKLPDDIVGEFAEEFQGCRLDDSFHSWAEVEARFPRRLNPNDPLYPQTSEKITNFLCFLQDPIKRSKRWQEQITFVLATARAFPEWVRPDTISDELACHSFNGVQKVLNCFKQIRYFECWRDCYVRDLLHPFKFLLPPKGTHESKRMTYDARHLLDCNIPGLIGPSGSRDTTEDRVHIHMFYLKHGHLLYCRPSIFRQENVRAYLRSYKKNLRSLAPLLPSLNAAIGQHYGPLAEERGDYRLIQRNIASCYNSVLQQRSQISYCRMFNSFLRSLKATEHPVFLHAVGLFYKAAPHYADFTKFLAWEWDEKVPGARKIFEERAGINPAHIVPALANFRNSIKENNFPGAMLHLNAAYKNHFSGQLPAGDADGARIVAAMGLPDDGWTFFREITDKTISDFQKSPYYSPLAAAWWARAKRK